MNQEKDSGKKLIVDPPFNSEIDASSILSLSLEGSFAVLITRDYKIKIFTNQRICPVERLLPKEHHNTFVEFEIRDRQNRILYPISAYLSNSFLVCLVSEVKNGCKRQIVYYSDTDDEELNKNLPFPFFVDIGDSIPVALFGNYFHSVAIDTNGAILYIYQYSYTEPQYLPDGEKAVDIALTFEMLFVLSSNGKLFKKKGAMNNKPALKQVKHFKNTKIIQISGTYNHVLVLTDENRVFAYGDNDHGKLGIGIKKEKVTKFTEILSLRDYKITNVYAGHSQSLFQTSNGEILSCGQNSSGVSNLIPVSTSIKKDANFCVIGIPRTAIFINSDAEMSPHRKIKDEIRIALFGGKEKTRFLQAFINNNYENSDSLQNEDEYYSIQIEIDKSVKVKIIIFDSSKIEDNPALKSDYYQLAYNLLFFYDLSNPDSMNDLEDFYLEANETWGINLKFAVVFYNSENSEDSLNNSNFEEIKNFEEIVKFKVNFKDIESINEPFYYFLYQNYKKSKEVIKVGKEHRNPFNDLKPDHINIGLFGNGNTNKTELAFIYVYDEFYEHFYNDFIKNFADIDLTKVIEIKGSLFKLSVIDSSFITNIDKSYYSAVQGLIFIFEIDILSNANYVDDIRLFCKDAKNSVQDDFNCIIALKLKENQQDSIEYQEKIKKISAELNCNVFIFSLETGQNINYMFHYLAKQFVIKQRQKKKSSQRKKHHSKK